MNYTKSNKKTARRFIKGRSPGSKEDSEQEMSEVSSIKTMSDMELDKQFEKMLANMNLSEEKKEPLRKLPIYKKREMLTMHYKTHVRTGLDSPIDYIHYLTSNEVAINKKSSCIESLRVALTSNSLEWVQEFGNKGLEIILEIIRDCLQCSPYCEKLHLECVKCLKAIMNNKVGLENLFNQSEALSLLARSIIPEKPQVCLEAIKLMAAVCLVPPDGHDATLEAISDAGDTKGVDRFQPIVQGLLICNNEPLRVASMTLINAIISSPEDLDFRLHLRNEFMRIGLLDVLEILVENPCEELETQLKVFLDHKEEDFEEFAARFDNIRFDLDDIGEVFDIVKQTVADTTAEPYLLSILQHLLCVRNDFMIRPAYYKLIEECVSQIVLHKSGCDPDFRSTRRFEIDVEPLIDHLVERGRIEDINSTRTSLVLPPSLEAAVTEKQELEAKLSQALMKIEDLENQLKKASSNNGKPTINAQPPPPPPPLPMPNPLQTSSTNVQTTSITKQSVPAPPPPPPPPPAPPSQIGTAIKSKIPSPPSAPSPPPPPSTPGLTVNQLVDNFAKLGMKRKKKWVVSGQLKRTNWKVIPVAQLTEKAFWAKVDEEKYASQTLISELQCRFGSKPSLVKLDSSCDPGSARKCKELRFLDVKAAQNLSLVLGGSLKHISYGAFKTCVLNCDTSVLTESLLQTLVQYLPDPEQFSKLSQFKNEADDLAEVESFVLSLVDVKRLVPRLKALLFKSNFSELVQDCKPGIVSATAACEEIRKSSKFARILELILLIGNIMNTGSRLEQSVGFDISYLTKLSNTKDKENKSTLLHFLVETVEAEMPDLLFFYEEILHLDKAAKVSLESIDKVLKLMESSLKSLKDDLTRTVDMEDKFNEIMTDFLEQAHSDYSILMAMRNKLDSLYSDIAEYFVFDKLKYSFEDFYGDIKLFKDQFKIAHEKIKEEREAFERAQKAKAAREKSMREKEERNYKKMALVELAMEDQEAGVMDCLLEALKSGTAFSRDGKRKKQIRLAGAERRAELVRSRSRLATRSQCDVFDIMKEDERSLSSVDVRHQRSFSEKLESALKVSEESDNLVRKLREL